MRPIYKFEINRPTVNLLNPKTVVPGLLNTSTGNISSSTIYQTSDFIPVTPGVNYKLCDAETFTAWAAAAACFYTANKTFISGQYGIGETPANAAYLRVSYQGLNDGYGVFPSTASSYSAYVSPIVYPLYKDDLAKEFSKESNQEFFRAKLSGKLTFESADYDFIVSRPFDFQFVLEIFISYNAGQTWTSYWRGTFWKTDCEFDGDAKTVIVKPTVWDQYNNVLAGLDKEFDLIDLAPEIVPIQADKRPMVQVYVPGQAVIGCFLSGMWWEQDCEPVSDTEMMDIGGGAQGRKLEYYYRFAINKGYTNIRLSGTMTPQLPASVSGVVNGQSGKYFDFYVDGVHYYRTADTNFDWIGIYDPNTGAAWRNSMVSHDLAGKYTVTVYPLSGTSATGDITLDIETIDVYSRFVCDTDTINSVQTYPIPSDDLVENNRNYSRIVGYYFPNTISFSDRHMATPTKWGLYQPGEYYAEPYSIYQPEYFPVARNGWGYVSVWFSFDAFDWIVERSGRKQFTIRYAYPLASVLSVLLAKIAPGITHQATTEYSEFLYGTNLIGITQTLLITPKSNIVNAGYDQPAQKAPITFRNILDMLRDCFRCYWFVDDQNRFRVEHIQYFRNGGSYSGTPVVGIDLTTQEVTRSGKKWSFARSQFKFDKPTMAARYQFGWMDDVTQLFDGFPINILSKYVNPDNIEQIQIGKFTSDIDYILLNPSEISKDGFVLLAGVPNNEMSASESYILDGNNFVTFREPIPEDWKGGTMKMRCTLSAGTGFLRVYMPNNTYNEAEYQAGDNEITVQVPTNAVKIYLYGTAGATLQITFVNVGKYVIPYVNYNPDGNDHYLQNGYVAFCILQNYYAYDMPAPDYMINGDSFVALGVKRLKGQSISFPALTDPNMLQLIKTNLGNGTIEKLSVNLSSRNANATLKYDTE